MRCPICGEGLRKHGPTMHAIWIEMESDMEAPMVVHVACAWMAISWFLSDRNHEDRSEGEWFGWEPIAYSDGAGSGPREMVRT